jgi:cell division protein FtsB
MATFFKENSLHLDNKKRSLTKEITINKDLQVRLAKEVEDTKAENEALQKQLEKFQDKRRDVLSYKKFMTCQPDEEIIVCQD